MKKLVSILLSTLLALTLGLSLIGCSTEKAEATSFVGIDINPSIELTLDQNDKVMSIRGTNEDGQVLLYGESSFEGLSVDIAIERITDLAVELGYLTEDENSVVNTTVSSKNEQLANKLKDKVNAKIKASVGDFEITVNSDTAYSLMRKYADFIANNPEYKDALSINKFKLALSASETGEITLDAAVELNDQELIKLISEEHSKLKEYATEKFLSKKEKVEKEFNEGVNGLINKLKEDPTFAHFSTMINPIIESLDAFKNTIKNVDFSAVENYQIDSVTAQNIVDGLNSAYQQASLQITVNLDDISKDGVVTLGSVYAYLDKVLKNIPSEEISDDIEDAVEDYIDDIEEKAEELNAVDLDLALKRQLNSILTQLNVTDVDLSDGLDKEEIDEIFDAFEDIIEDMIEEIESTIEKSFPGLKNHLENLHKEHKADREREEQLMQEQINQVIIEEQTRLQTLKNNRRAQFNK